MPRIELAPRPALLSRIAEASSVCLLVATFAIIQVLIGGTRLLFSFPAYLVLGLIGLLTVFSLRRAKALPGRTCLWTSAAFFGYVLARALFSPVPYLARVDIYSVIAGLIVYLFVACILTEPTRRISILLSLLLIGMVHVFIGALQFRNGNNFMLIPFLQRFDYGRRASGFYICPNHLAGLLEVVGVFGLSIVCWNRWRAPAKLLTAYAVGICYLGLILTGSRGGYLSAAASLAVFGTLSLITLRKTSSKLFWKIAGAGLIVAAILGLATFSFVKKSNFLSNRAQSIVDPDNIRLQLWQAALEQWKLSPFLGTGSGTYLYYGRQFRAETVQKDPIEVHNDYLHLLAEYGLIGAATFLAFFAAHLRRGWKNFVQLEPKRVAIARQLLSNSLALNLGALSAVAAYLLHSILDFNLHIPANVLLLAFVFGILANPGAERAAPDEQAANFTLLVRLALPALALILMIQGARLLPGEWFAERSRTELRDGHPASSILFAQRGLAYEDANPNLYGYLGRARVEQGDGMIEPRARASFYRAAIEALQAGRAVAPEDETFAVELAFAYDGLGRFPEAEWMFLEARALDPKSASIQQYYSSHLERWSRLVDAVEPYAYTPDAAEN